MKKLIIATLGVIGIAALLSYFYIQHTTLTKAEFDEDVADLPPLAIPLGLPPIPWPKDNPYSKEKAELGRLLYFDKRLSSNGTIACATCHTVHDAFTDRKPISEGIEGRHGTRNAPTVINAAYLKKLFWDGRVNSLEEQAKGPIANPNEMTTIKDVHAAHKECVDLIRAIPGYRPLFKEAFGTEVCTMENIAQALATFERTVLSGNSPFDRFVAGDKTALTEEQIQGLRVFRRTNCINCHNGPEFTDGRFANIGVGMDEPNPDLGRYLITHDEKDWGAFKTPTLRDVEKTYPYMHDGKLWTLEEVVEYYDKGGIPNRNLHPSMVPLHLSESDKKALVSFMKSLSGEGWQHFTEPTAFPK